MKLIISIIILILNIESISSANRYRDQFKTICGQQTKTRIVGGENAKLGEFPWITRIGLKNPFPKYHCAGSLITDRHVLTAEHCFYTVIKKQILNRLIVSLGNYQRNGYNSCVDNQCSDTPVVYDIEKLIPYGLDDSTFEDDIAILQTEKKVTFTRWISPICLPDNISPSILIGDDVMATGFGVVNSIKRKEAEFLQKITISIKPAKDCGKFLKLPGPGQICAGNLHKDTCDGDSGGPLFKFLNETNISQYYILVGITSYGSVHCENSSPAVYTNVQYYLEWIDNHLDNCEN